MSLRDTQELFWRAVRYDPAPPEVDQAFLDHGGLTGRERLAIYRDMYWARQVSALRLSFEHLEAVLGAEAFTRLAVRYVRHHPSEHGALERLGRDMAAHLAFESQPTWLVDLGRLEWERLDALLCPDDPGPASAQDIDPDRFAEQIPQVVGSLRVVRLDVEALRLFRAVDAHEPLAPLLATLRSGEADDRQVPVAVWRRNHSVRHVSLTAPEAEALAQAARGASLGTICGAFAHEPDPVQAAMAVVLPWFSRHWIATLD